MSELIRRMNEKDDEIDRLNATIVNYRREVAQLKLEIANLSETQCESPLVDEFGVLYCGLVSVAIDRNQRLLLRIEEAFRSGFDAANFNRPLPETLEEAWQRYSSNLVGVES